MGPLLQLNWRRTLKENVMKIMKYIILILAVVQAGSLSAEVLHPDVDLATEYFNKNGWENYTVGLDPTSSYGATPIETIKKVRVRSASFSTSTTVTVRLYSDNTGTTLVSSSATGNGIELGSDVWEYTLQTPFDVTSGTQMLAVVLLPASLDVDITRTGYTVKYGKGSANPTRNKSRIFFAIQYVFGVPPTRRRVIITESFIIN